MWTLEYLGHLRLAFKTLQGCYEPPSSLRFPALWVAGSPADRKEVEDATYTRNGYTLMWRNHKASHGFTIKEGHAVVLGDHVRPPYAATIYGVAMRR